MKKSQTSTYEKNLFKRWYILANPNKKIWALQIFFFICYTVLLTLITIFAARTIDCMYNDNWNGAFLNLALELITIILRSLFAHIQHKFYNDQVTYIRVGVANKIYDKLISCEASGIKRLSKEKILNISLNNMDNLSDFPDVVASFIAYLVQVVIILVMVFVANYWAGLIILALGFANFFAYYGLNRAMGKAMRLRHEKKDAMHYAYNKIIDGKSVISEFKGRGRKKYNSEINHRVNDYCGALTKYFMLSSVKNNLYFAIWNIVVYAVTALLLFFVSKGDLDIAVYLVIVPYLTTCTEKLNSLFDKTNSLENMRVDVDRVNLILNLNDKQLVKFGRLNSKTEGYNLGFIDVSYACDDIRSDNFGKLVNVDLSFKMQGINVVKGDKGCGKRLVFNMLRRQIKPNGGMILLDNLDIYKFNEKNFAHHIYYCASHPEFVRGTIKENLLLMCKNFAKVENVCQKVGLSPYIEKMPLGYDTQIQDIKSSGVLFLIGLVRAVLSNCNVLMIYELPQNAPATFRNKVKSYLKERDRTKTVIMFTHSDEYDDIADLEYVMTDGKAKAVSLKKTKN